MQVTRTVTTVPVGVVRIDMYQSATENGIYAKTEEIVVQAGDTTITFEATDFMWHKFKQVDSQGAESDFSSAWYFDGVDPGQPPAQGGTVCHVSGTCQGPNGEAVAGVIVTATLIAQTIVNDANVQLAGAVQATTNEAGEWGMDLVPTTLLEDAFAKYVFTFEGEGFDETRTVTVPNQATADYEDLPVAGSLVSDYKLSFELDEESQLWYVGEVKAFSVTVLEENDLLTSLPGHTARLRLYKVEDGITTDVMAWGTAGIDGMKIRRQFDSAALSPSSTTRKYLLACELSSPAGEKMLAKPFKVKFKAA